MHLTAIGLLVVLSAMTVQARAEQASQAANPAPGVLVDVGGGDRLHLRAWGEPNDKPAIVLDAHESHGDAHGRACCCRDSPAHQELSRFSLTPGVELALARSLT